MRDCFAIYLFSSTSQYQISGPDFVTRPLIQTLCSGLWWCIVFVPYTPHPMPGRNRTCYNYLPLTLFVCLFVCLFVRPQWYYLVWELLWLFSLKYERSKTEFSLWWITHLYPTIHHDLASIPLGQSRITSRPSTTRLCYQAHRLSVTTLPSPLLIE